MFFIQHYCSSSFDITATAVLQPLCGSVCVAFSALTLLIGQQEEHVAHKKLGLMWCWHGYLSGARSK